MLVKIISGYTEKKYQVTFICRTSNVHLRNAPHNVELNIMEILSESTYFTIAAYCPFLGENARFLKILLKW